MLFAPNSDLLPSYRRSRNRDSSEPGNVFPIFSDVISDCNLLKPMPNSGPSSRIATTSFALASQTQPFQLIRLSASVSLRISAQDTGHPLLPGPRLRPYLMEHRQLEIAASSKAGTRVSLTSLFKLQKQFVVMNTRR